MGVGEFGLALAEGSVGLLFVRADAAALVDGDGEGAVDAVDAGGVIGGRCTRRAEICVDVEGGVVLGVGGFDVVLRGPDAGSGGFHIGPPSLGAP